MLHYLHCRCRSTKGGGGGSASGPSEVDGYRSILSKYTLKGARGEWMDGWMDGWMYGWMDRWMDGWMDGWIDSWMDGWMDGAACCIPLMSSVLLCLLSMLRYSSPLLLVLPHLNASVSMHPHHPHPHRLYPPCRVSEDHPSTGEGAEEL